MGCAFCLNTVINGAQIFSQNLECVPSLTPLHTKQFGFRRKQSEFGSFCQKKKKNDHVLLPTLLHINQSEFRRIHCTVVVNFQNTQASYLHVLCTPYIYGDLVCNGKLFMRVVGHGHSCQFSIHSASNFKNCMTSYMNISLTAYGHQDLMDGSFKMTMMVKASILSLNDKYNFISVIK